VCDLKLDKVKRRDRFYDRIAQEARFRGVRRCRQRAIRGMVLAAVLAAWGCAGGVNPAGEAVLDLATTIADPTNGINQEITDIGAYVFASTAGLKGSGIAGAKGVTFPDSFVLYMRDRLKQGSFNWNTTSGAYELTETSIPISAGDVSGTISSLELTVTFFTSSDVTGTGVELTDPAAGLASGAGTIRSLRYHRQLSGTLTNSYNGVSRDFSAQTDLTARWSGGTGLSVDGTHTRSFTHSFPGGRTASGTISLEIIALPTSWEQLGYFSYFVTAEGIITGVYDATVDRPDGSSQALTKTGFIEFARTEFATVSVIGLSVRVNLISGRV
jgi:hypothetical protein